MNTLSQKETNPLFYAGNDIVDLNDPDASSFYDRERFLLRVFTDEEITYIEESSEQEQLLWTIWSAKEAAYKALRAHHNIPFRWREFQIADDLLSIRFRDYELVTISVGGMGFVHTIALGVSKKTKNDLKQIYSELIRPVRLWITPFPSEKKLSSDEESLYLKKFCMESVASELASPLDEFSFKESDDALPVLCFQNESLNYPLSLSHHGRYGAVLFYRSDLTSFYK